MDPAGPGFHGKLPSRGDFLTRGLPRSFVDPWDDWLQRAIASSREALGNEWLAIYLESPVWRFALSAGVCGSESLVGLFLPSVDKVGRYFPFTIAECVSPATSPFAVLGGGAWFDEVERLAMAALDDVALDPDELHAALASCGVRRPAPAMAIGSASADVVVVPIGDGSHPEEGLPALGDALLTARSGHRALWWTRGSDLCPPLLVASGGLPSPAFFRTFLTGRVG